MTKSNTAKSSSSLRSKNHKLAKHLGGGRGHINRGMSSGFRRAPLKKEDIKRDPANPVMETQDLTKTSLAKTKWVVYPSHGVGQVLGFEEREVGDGQKIELVVVSFDTEKLTLRLPLDKAKKDGLRSLLSKPQMDTVLKILKGKGKIKRIMWAKRAQEYEAKINSGDASLVAEVIRDLYRPPNKPEQSFSEKQLFQTAVERLAKEVAAIENTNLDHAAQKLHHILDHSH